MSGYIHLHLPALLRAPPHSSQGQPVRGTGHAQRRETQAPFQGICGDFKRARERLVQQRSFFVQAGWSAGRYVRRVTRKARGVTQLMYLPGAPKPGDVSLKRRQTDLTRAASHLFRIHDLATFDAEQVNDGGLRNTLLRLKDAPEKWCGCAPTSRLAAPTCSPA